MDSSPVEVDFGLLVRSVPGATRRLLATPKSRDCGMKAGRYYGLGGAGGAGFGCSDWLDAALLSRRKYAAKNQQIPIAIAT